MKKLLLLSIVFMNTIVLLHAQGNTWNQKANFGGTARAYSTSFSIGAKGYIGAGLDNTSTFDYQDFWEWDQTSNTWTQKADFGGGGRWSASGFSIGTKGYIGTGIHNGALYQDFWEWDQASNTWSQKTDFGGVVRSGATSFSIGTKGYIGTGWDNSGIYYADFWEWDQTTDTWTQKTDFGGIARAQAVGFSIGTKGYVVAGEGPQYNLHQDLWEWDQATNTWTQQTDFGGTARRGAVGFSIGTNGYVGTGWGQAGPMQDFWEWNQSGNIWTEMDSFPSTIRQVAAGFSIGNKGYIGIGANSAGNCPCLQDFWEYTPSQTAPISSFQSSDSTICANDCIGFSDRSANNPTSWLWTFTGAFPATSTDQNPPLVCYTASGNYNVQLIASNSGGSDTLTLTDYITVSAAPPVPAIKQVDGDTLFCSNNPSYISYQWYDSTYLIPGATDTFLVITQGGNYNVQVANDNGCKVATGINVIIGIQNYISDNTFSLYPNPASNQLFIHTSSFHSEALMVSVMNVLGQKTSSPTVLQGKGEDTVINVSELSAGIYFLEMKTESGSVMKKFVKE